MLKEIGHICDRKKIHNQELRSPKNLGYHETIFISLSKKHFKNICFALSIKIMSCYIKFYFKQ